MAIKLIDRSRVLTRPSGINEAVQVKQTRLPGNFPCLAGALTLVSADFEATR
jgi:hypothetical protein